MQQQRERRAYEYSVVSNYNYIMASIVTIT